MQYEIPEGVYAIPPDLLDLRSDEDIDQDLMNSKPVAGEKNAWFFWHSGYSTMHGYTKRNIRAWHRRFSPHGWTMRVLDRVPDSPMNVANFLDVHDANTFPGAFIDGKIGGTYGIQHTSDLVRFPLLLKYGGVYADVGLMQIGDLNRLWEETIGNPTSPYEVLSYNAGGVEVRDLTNYFIGSNRTNPFFARCHKLLLALWAEDGGRESTEGMRNSPLLKDTRKLMDGWDLGFEENGRTYSPKEVAEMLSDYIIQGQVMTLVAGLVDEEDGWNGPEYFAERVYAIEYMVGSQLINEFTKWDGNRAFELMSMSLPKDGETESQDQKQAREIVEACLSESFGFKLVSPDKAESIHEKSSVNARRFQFRLMDS